MEEKIRAIESEKRSEVTLTKELLKKISGGCNVPVQHWKTCPYCGYHLYSIHVDANENLGKAGTLIFCDHCRNYSYMEY